MYLALSFLPVSQPGGRIGITPLKPVLPGDDRGDCYIKILKAPRESVTSTSPRLPTNKLTLLGGCMILADQGEINPLELYFELCQDIRDKIAQDCSLGAELREMCSLRDSLELIICLKR